MVGGAAAGFVREAGGGGAGAGDAAGRGHGEGDGDGGEDGEEPGGVAASDEADAVLGDAGGRDGAAVYGGV